METTTKLGMNSKKIILAGAIVLFAGSLTAITADQVNPLEKNPSTFYIVLMFFALLLIYLAAAAINNNNVNLISSKTKQHREHYHHKKTIRKTS